MVRSVLAVLMIAALGVGCGDDSPTSSSGGVDGTYGGIENFLTNIRVVDLSSNTPPIAEDCLGEILITIDTAAEDVISGTGTCLLPANSVTYTLVGDFDDDQRREVSGQMTLALSRVTHVVPWSGTLTGGVLEATFAARTPQVGNLVIDWDGEFNAERGRFER